MATTILAHPAKTYAVQRPATSVFSKFFNWCAGQEENRLLWLGLALAGHGCILTPLTIFAVVLAGTNIVFFMAALVAMAMALVTNLAAMPTKYTIPIFLFTILVDLGIIIACMSMGFNPGAAL